MKPDPRKLAVSVLSALDARPNLTLDRHMERLREESHSALAAPRDAAFFQALVYGAVRRRGYLDHVISRLSKTPPDEIDPPVKQILRLGLFQLFFMDRVPDAAAVHTSVEMSKSLKKKWISGYVNGVLRNAARKRNRIPLPSRARDFAQWLSVTQSMPRWLVDRWIFRFGRQTAESLCAACNEIPPLTIRANALRHSREEVAAAILAGQAAGRRPARISEKPSGGDLSGEPGRKTGEIEIVPTKFSPDGLILRGVSGAVMSVPTFTGGGFQVQDEAAQIASLLLAPRPGERTLDACAGSGGKTGHLARLMDDRGELVAADCAPEKLKRLEGEMARLGVRCAAARVLDLNAPLPEDLGTFDRILVDAPCSGLGVLRRNPDGKWKAAGEDLGRYAARQSRFLKRLAPVLRPGGRMVYAVCSMEPEEGHEIAKAFLAAHPDFAPIPDQGAVPPSVSPPLDRLGRFTSRPDLHGMDGFFAAGFVRSA